MKCILPEIPIVGIQSTHHEPAYAVSLTVEGAKEILAHCYTFSQAFSVAYGVACGVEALSGVSPSLEFPAGEPTPVIAFPIVQVHAEPPA